MTAIELNLYPSNISIIHNKEEAKNKTRGSLSFSFDFLKPLSKNVQLAFGPRIGYNTNETLLTNLHVSGEYFFAKNWSAAVELGLNYLIDNQNYLQTNSNIILRFYI